MRKSLLLTMAGIFIQVLSFAQCTPVNCIASLPAYGGLCDTVFIDGRIGTPYSDFESFVITNACFDAGIISPANAGTNIRIVRIDNFTFSKIPTGMTPGTNATVYTAPTNSTTQTTGCISLTGTPTVGGVFYCRADFLVDINAYPFGCSAFAVAQNNNAAGYGIRLIILPNPAFTMANTSFCASDTNATAMTVTGTAGGTFTGPGVVGNNFYPQLAGAGTHTLTYVVSVQDTAAAAPAVDSMSMTVTVNAASAWFMDMDNDGYGDTTMFQLACVQPTGFVSNATDCDDSNNQIYPGATEIPNNGIDEDCSGSDLTTTGLITEIENINMYPNPGDDRVFIQSNQLRNLNAEITIYSMNGTMMSSNQVTDLNGTIEINTHDLSSGMYIIRINTEKSQAQLKWIKK